MEINLLNDLFMCPVYCDGDPCGADGLPLPPEQPDEALHYTVHAAQMQAAGSALVCLDEMPAAFAPATEASGGMMHLRKITAPDGRDFIPLFLEYRAMTDMFGDKIHIGIVSFADVRQRCIEESDIAGIVIAPGSLNMIFTREMLMQEH